MPGYSLPVEFCTKLLLHSQNLMLGLLGILSLSPTPSTSSSDWIHGYTLCRPQLLCPSIPMMCLCCSPALQAMAPPCWAISLSAVWEPLSLFYLPVRLSRALGEQSPCVSRSPFCPLGSAQCQSHSTLSKNTWWTMNEWRSLPLLGFWCNKRKRYLNIIIS